MGNIKTSDVPTMPSAMFSNSRFFKDIGFVVNAAIDANIKRGKSMETVQCPMGTDTDEYHALAEEICSKAKSGFLARSKEALKSKFTNAADSKGVDNEIITDDDPATEADEDK